MPHPHHGRIVDVPASAHAGLATKESYLPASTSWTLVSKSTFANGFWMNYTSPSKTP
jgi:hypothetical protein